MYGALIKDRNERTYRLKKFPEFPCTLDTLLRNPDLNRIGASDTCYLILEDGDIYTWKNSFLNRIGASDTCYLTLEDGDIYTWKNSFRNYIVMSTLKKAEVSDKVAALVKNTLELEALRRQEVKSLMDMALLVSVREGE